MIDTREKMIDMIFRQDVVQIIRCRDCKHYDGEWYCNRYADETFGQAHSTQPYGYCWLAERREDG